MTRPQPFRLGQGGLIDRGVALEFEFNGTCYRGYEGDSLASALLANGVKVVARSFKYHRPRGIFTAGEEEPCALVELGRGSARIPTCRAPAVQLHNGLASRSQKGWPSLRFDLGRIVDFTHALWPAGFYNKTFKWPNWGTWEPAIRRSAGLGRVPDGPDPDRYERMNWHCDLLICGGGLTGLQAALIAGRSGMRVLLAEQSWQFGGSALAAQIGLDDRPSMRWICDAVTELESLPNVLLLAKTTVTGIYDHKLTTMVQAGKGAAWRECYWQVRPRRILLATGAVEQGLIFPNNDRPGIILAGAVREYLNRYAVVPGRRIVIACNNDSAYQTALDLARSGITVEAVVDEREKVQSGLSQAVADLDIRHYTDTRITATKGRHGTRAVRIQTGRLTSQWLRCDLLAVSGGWAPRVHLLSHAGGRLRFDSDSQSFVPDVIPDGIHIAGAVTGPCSLADALVGAESSVRNVGASLGVKVPSAHHPQVTREPIVATQTRWLFPGEFPGRQWIDLAHDVTTHDAALAVREGFESVEHFKRYTTAGMSVDQGKTSSTNTFLVLSSLTGADPSESGTTTFRPPYSPVSAGVMAAQAGGDLYAPRRFLPAHTVHQSLGAHFEDFGWQRPEFYRRAGDSPQDSVTREVCAVRNNVGVFDNSPIGKLEVVGPDAAVFLDRLYINNLRNLEPGRARYGLMLNENGVVIDDGIVICLTPDHFVVHTTSAHAQGVHEMMEEWLQCEWPQLKLAVHNATAQWANFTVAGPQSLKVLGALNGTFERPLDSLPHMSVTRGKIGDIKVRLSRVSYSGELSYEINVPASFAASIFRTILKSGKPHDITPFGIEALMVLRTEKGYLHVGTDTDGSTTPDDVGWGEVARRKKRDFIGRRSLFREANMGSGRKQLVGLAAIDPGKAIPAGGHLLLDPRSELPCETDGWVTSACHSPTLNCHIALAMLRDGRRHHGKPVRVYDQGHYFEAKVVSPVFYDENNSRLA